MWWPTRFRTQLRTGLDAQRRLPRIVRFLALHCLMGTALGAGFAGLLMMINLGGLMDLIATSDQPALPIAMLVVGCALTFGSATMAAAVMSIDPDE